MPLRKPDIEAALAAHHGRKFCVLTNRGTTALAAAFHALGRPGEGVVFPAAMCSIPVFAASFAGMKPLFADVSLSDGNFDKADLERVLSGGKIAAVVPLHMFGKPEDMEAVDALARRHGASVVEDVALSMGAVHKGRPTGAWGRLSCLSFVRKMIPLEMGGAVLTDEAALAEKARRFVEALPPSPPGHIAETPPLMRAFHAATGYVAAGGWARRDLLAPFEAEFRRLFLCSTSEADWEESIVLRELGSLPEAVTARRARAEVYDGALSHPRIVPMDHGESCFFAYPVRLKDLSVEGFLSFASSKGLVFKRIAYPDVSPIFSPSPWRGEGRGEGGYRFPNAATLEKEAIGFPVDDDQPVSSFWEYAADFTRTLEEYLASSPAESDWRGKLEMRMA